MLTHAKARVANYPFTTLEANLGAYYGLILADIPGLIEGSSSGRGLGIKFLRHIERTRILFHFVFSESPDPEKDYKTIPALAGILSQTLRQVQCGHFPFLTFSAFAASKLNVRCMNFMSSLIMDGPST